MSGIFLMIYTLFDSDHIDDLLADRTAEIIVHKTESVSVIRRGKVIPDRNRNFILITERNDIAEPVFTVFIFDVTDGINNIRIVKHLEVTKPTDTVPQCRTDHDQTGRIQYMDCRNGFLVQHNPFFGFGIGDLFINSNRISSPRS